MIPVDDSKARRFVILYNFWSTHTPGPPNCQIPDFSTYSPICEQAPTAKYLLPKSDLNMLRKCGRVKPVQEDILDDPSQMEWSSDFGELPFAMPLPVLLPRSGLVVRLLWRHAAEHFLGWS